MKTQHTILYQDARNLGNLPDESVELVVTSPPYPMIAMWDDILSTMDPKITTAMNDDDGNGAHHLMHTQLNRVWDEVARLLVPGGIACVNIGDATRTVGKKFQLFSNEVHIINRFVDNGFSCLPLIIWSKPTNSPTKFMGSGMLPGGAYVTLEHEKILIFKKNGSRDFNSEESKLNSRLSSYFWEERNKWFSDIWTLSGEKQIMNSQELRSRSGAYPFEIPLRLISMYSVKGDTVLDPFLGTATTTLSAIVTGRNSIGIESDQSFRDLHNKEIPSSDFINQSNKWTAKRIQKHLEFIDNRILENKDVKYQNKYYGFPVVTNQETDIRFEKIESIERSDNSYITDYTEFILNENEINEAYVQDERPVSRGFYSR